MSTRHGIRSLVFAALVTGALITTPSQAGVSRAHETSAIASLGQITVLASRIEPADLGHLVVSAARLPEARLADLGGITVSASRIADARVADVGAMTVTARRIATLTVASARSSVQLWK